MGNKDFLEVGKIVNTHGVRGEVRIQTWTDSPDMLLGLENVCIGSAQENQVKLISPRVHKSFVIAYIEGVNDIDAAIKLKNKVVYANRKDLQLEEGQYFIVDLVGLKAIDAESGNELGVIKEVLTLPKNNVYVIKGEREILIPAVPDFVVETNIEAGYIKFRLIEGL